MDTPRTTGIEVLETTSAEQASQLRRAGWVVLAIGKAHDQSGEACLKFTLGQKRAAGSAPSSDSPHGSHPETQRQQRS